MTRTNSLVLFRHGLACRTPGGFTIGSKLLKAWRTPASPNLLEKFQKHDSVDTVAECERV